MNRKVTVVGGAGNVGMTVARAIAEKELADVVIIDIADQKAAGVALDIYETCPIIGSDSRVIGGSDWNAAAGSDIVVITSGKPRKPGMSRDDLVRDNFEIMKSIAPNLVQHCPNAIVVPVASYSTVAGIPLTELLPKDRIDAIAKRTADGGAEITKLVGTSAWYAPGQAAAEMCEAILKDKKKILPCSVYLQGEYGVRDLFVGVPVKLGARGVEQIIEIKLTAEEEAALKKSAASVKELVDVIGM